MPGPEPEAEDELVLLADPLGKAIFLATIPADAQLHAVPDEDGIDARIRGLIFARTNWTDQVLGLAIFRKKARQL